MEGWRWWGGSDCFLKLTNPEEESLVDVFPVSDGVEWGPAVDFDCWCDPSHVSGDGVVHCVWFVRC